MLNQALLRFAQTADPNVNVPTEEFEPVVTELSPEQTQAAESALAGLGVFMTAFLIFSVINFIFFVIALIHLIKHADVSNRVLWILVSIFVPFGAILYVLGPRRSYNKNGPIKTNSGIPTGATSGMPQQQNSTTQYTAPNPATTAAATGAAVTPIVSDQSSDQSSAQTSTEIAQAPETPIVPPTTNPSPQVAAAPENPVQVPEPLPTAPETFQPESSAPSDPTVVQPTPSPEQQVNNPQSNDDNNQPPVNPVGQA